LQKECFPVYIVKTGDTCYSISKKCDVSLDEMIKRNGKNKKDCSIKSDEKLFLSKKETIRPEAKTPLEKEKSQSVKTNILVVKGQAANTEKAAIVSVVSGKASTTSDNKSISLSSTPKTAPAASVSVRDIKVEKSAAENKATQKTMNEKVSIKVETLEKKTETQNKTSENSAPQKQTSTEKLIITEKAVLIEPLAASSAANIKEAAAEKSDKNGDEKKHQELKSQKENTSNTPVEEKISTSERKEVTAEGKENKKNPSSKEETKQKIVNTLGKEGSNSDGIVFSGKAGELFHSPGNLGKVVYVGKVEALGVIIICELKRHINGKIYVYKIIVKNISEAKVGVGDSVYKGTLVGTSKGREVVIVAFNSDGTIFNVSDLY